MAISYIVLNVSDLGTSSFFYSRALAPLGFTETESTTGVSVRLTNGTDAAIVLTQADPIHAAIRHNPKSIGIHHVAFAVKTLDEFELMESHLRRCGVPLRGSGRTSSTYRGGYQSLVIHDPDGMVIEIVHYYPPTFYSNGVRR